MAQPASDALSTPKKQRSAIREHSETPRSRVLDAGNTKINDNRSDILEVMKPEISECSLDRFRDHYAPFKIPEDEVSAIISKLLEKKTKKKTSYICTQSAEGKRVFTAFNKPPGPKNEDGKYRPLEDIALAIAEAALEVDEFASKRTLNYFFRCCSRTQLRSDTAGSDHLVDGVFEKCCTCGHEEAHTLSRHSKVVQNHANSDVIQMRNIASVFEFKTKETDANKYDNGKKVVSASVQLMNEDPRRMFSYAFTIERSEITLWYFCRSHSVMAGHIRLDSPDDFERLVTTFLSFMFATPEEMGYDPTITVHEDEDETQYTYKIPGDEARPQRSSDDRFFRTVASIDDPRSLNITGRSTRVWEVQEMESAEDNAATINDGIHYVLKDVWLESAAPTEWEIQKQIFADIESFLSKTSESLSNDGLAELSALQQKHANLLEDDAFKRYFMTIIADYEGRHTPAYAKHGTRSIPNTLEEIRRTSSTD
ncbi:hypothetical protein CPC08DRAFT_771215 [Agrocybe pediades]|nr:hypothetical protein CPC08DRAFT_771215 [Agrocybe pediades]